jgi:formate hydrogenlyase subunit 4
MFGLFSNPRFIKIINDLFRDSNSKKTSLTRILAIILFFIVIWFHIEAISIMIEKKEIDHALIFEDFAFISALIMHKNYINRNNKEGVETTPSEETPTD